ncbi:unnamed protein product [Soboliphyme baturini]|uniref:Phytanoyl-CoA dioxygenase n=1 Tax=Soboliphyme baturini TaxID=241478 RepID=A0A183J930_9BILA|nr:unnamed protein product [Soboliphyme baturini]
MDRNLPYIVQKTESPDIIRDEIESTTKNIKSDRFPGRDGMKLVHIMPGGMILFHSLTFHADIDIKISVEEVPEWMPPCSHKELNEIDIATWLKEGPCLTDKVEEQVEFCSEDIVKAMFEAKVQSVLSERTI